MFTHYYFCIFISETWKSYSSFWMRWWQLSSTNSCNLNSTSWYLAALNEIFIENIMKFLWIDWNLRLFSRVFCYLKEFFLLIFCASIDWTQKEMLMTAQSKYTNVINFICDKLGLISISDYYFSIRFIVTFINKE